MNQGYWHPLHEALVHFGTTDRATAMQRYMRDLFPFAGVPSPLRKELLSAFIQQHPLPASVDLTTIMLEAWAYPEREMHYCAMELLWKWRKRLTSDDHTLLEQLIRNKSWWDTVDYLSGTMAGYFFQRFPEQERTIPESWMESGHLWLQRSAILYQLKYKGTTDQQRLFAYCSRLVNEKDFFIRKAIGWALRQYAKTEPEAVKTFVESTALSPLSKREALKHL